jgi:hypothetical protein
VPPDQRAALPELTVAALTVRFGTLTALDG